MRESTESEEICRIEVRLTGTASIAAVFGELDLDTAPSVQTMVLAACERPTADGLTVDLRGVSFMDSAGLHLLLALRQDTERCNVPLRVIRPASTVFRTVEVAGLQDAFQFVDEPG